MQLGRKDIAWNLIATCMRIASGLIVLPLVLRLLTKEEVGLWNIFVMIGSVVTLLDFGFSNSFARNITYIFSGAKTLKAQGYETIDKSDNSVDYDLLKSVIRAMRWFYGIMSIVFLFLFTVLSPFYLSKVLAQNNYSGDHNEIWIAWFVYGVLIAYQLYTYYYGSMLTGRGMVRQNLKNTALGQAFRIVSILVLLLLDFGIISLVIGQFIGDFLTRTLNYWSFYDKDIKAKLLISKLHNTKEIMKIMTPNAVKIGITSIGGFLVNKAVLLIASLYLTLPEIGSYGTTKQFIDLIASFGVLWFSTFYPKITLHRVNDELPHLKRMYIKGKLVLIFAFIVFGTGLVITGPALLEFIHSKTPLLSAPMMVVFLIVSFLESNHSMSGQMLMTKNEVPFAKPSIIAGITTVALLYILFTYSSLGIWTMILVPGVAQGVYNNWKWPLEVAKELKIRSKDYKIVLFEMLKFK